MKKFVPQILDRHLVEDRNFSMADLKNSSNQTYVLQTKNGGLNIKVSVDPKDRKSGNKLLYYEGKILLGRNGNWGRCGPPRLIQTTCKIL